MTFLERLQSGEIIIADGAMGTMLAQHGVDLTGCVEQVNLDKPENGTSSQIVLFPCL